MSYGDEELIERLNSDCPDWLDIVNDNLDCWVEVNDNKIVFRDEDLEEEYGIEEYGIEEIEYGGFLDDYTGVSDAGKISSVDEFILFVQQSCLYRRYYGEFNYGKTTSVEIRDNMEYFIESFSCYADSDEEEDEEDVDTVEQEYRLREVWFWKDSMDLIFDICGYTDEEASIDISNEDTVDTVLEKLKEYIKKDLDAMNLPYADF